jgi:hypothetical protein
MVLRLARVLDMPLREQNVMLIAAGFAPLYPARDLADPELLQVRKALDCMLRQQEPYPAMVIDRHCNLRMGNDAVERLLTWLMFLYHYYHPGHPTRHYAPGVASGMFLPS